MVFGAVVPAKAATRGLRGVSGFLSPTGVEDDVPARDRQTSATTQLTEPPRLSGHPPPRHQPPPTILPFMFFMHFTRFMLRLLSNLTAPQTHPGQAPSTSGVHRLKTEHFKLNHSSRLSVSLTLPYTIWALPERSNLDRRLRKASIDVPPSLLWIWLQINRLKKWRKLEFACPLID